MADRTILLDPDTPDPTKAISVFLGNMRKARQLGFTPSSAHLMAEHFLRHDVSLVFYSSAGGTIALAADDEALDSDDSFEVVQFVMERVAARRKAKRLEKQAAEERAMEGLRDGGQGTNNLEGYPSADAKPPTPDRSGEAGETTKIGSTEGESGLPRSGRPNEVK